MTAQNFNTVPRHQTGNSSEGATFQAVFIPRPEQVQRFKQLYRERLGEEIGEDEALEQFISLLTIVKYKRENSNYRRRFTRERDIHEKVNHENASIYSNSQA